MIQMHVSRDHVIDGITLQAMRFECGQQVRHRTARTGFDEGRPAVLDHQKARVEARTDKVRVDDADAVVQALQEAGHALPRSNPSSTSLPIVRPRSSIWWARRRFAALIEPRLSASVVRSVPLSIRLD